jgi:hypothetical protein
LFAFGMTKPGVGGKSQTQDLSSLSPLPSITTRSASCHRRVRLLFFYRWKSEKKASVPQYSCDGIGPLRADNGKDIVIMTFNAAVRGRQVFSGRELHAQEGRTRECGRVCAHNATITATMESASYRRGRVYMHPLRVHLAGEGD